MSETTKTERETYVAYCRVCEGIIAAAVESLDNREKQRLVAREVGKWVRDGLKVEKIETDAARKGRWCECWRAREKPAPKAPAKPVFGEVPAGHRVSRRKR